MNNISGFINKLHSSTVSSFNVSLLTKLRCTVPLLFECVRDLVALLNVSISAFMRTKQTLIAADAKILFNLSIRCAPRGLPFHVCFSIDADGMLKVSAEEETSGNKKDITITNENGRLSREEIERMIQEAEHFKSEDMKHVKKARAMRALDDYVYNMKKIMNDNSVTSKLTAIDKVKINSSIVKGEELIDDEDHETFVFVDVLRELESIFESTMKKINKGYSNDESDSDS
ncbi:hypothetical protein RYX36_010995 [Vicia faba]